MFIDWWCGLSTFSVGFCVTVDPEYTDGWGLIVVLDLGICGVQLSLGLPKDQTTNA